MILTSVVALASVVVAPNASPPNVLVLLIDDMGYSDLPAFGSKNVSTPHIDALVASGARFTQWISAAPICTPSRAALQTGRYPIRTGCIGNVERYRVIPTPANPHGLDPRTETSLATALRRANCVSCSWLDQSLAGV
jgi:arylsulfatase A